MLLDIIGILLIILAFIRGYGKGVIVGVFSMLGVVLGMLVALKFSGVFADYLLKRDFITSAWAQVVSFVLLFLGMILLVRLVAKLIEGLIKAASLGLVNRLAGGTLYSLIGLLIWSALLWIANRAHFISPETLSASRSYEFMVPVAPWVYTHIGDVLPMAKDVFSDLGRFFDQVNTHLPGHVGSH